jgi:peptidoglycan/LPS O-acetylase OafA/YrhL
VNDAQHTEVRSFRPEIQGLRAVAVLAVLAYHLWPAAVPGGFVGVDVFFVISGYLITGLLLADAEARGSISITRFYARRIKRLLPAATCVLLAAAAMTALLPPERREEASIEIATSALYVQNYWLAEQARDYLAVDEAPSLLQHYWSLSVEEQYYIAWPLLLALLGLVPGLRARPRAAFFAIIVAALLGSLAHSVVLTAEDAGQAYFATTTRAWELALGGLLAVLRPRAWPRLAVGAAGVAGLACIGVACALYGQGTPFPGYTALLPTLGAAALIAAPGSGARAPSAMLLRSAPMQYLGGISYSLYLWHWPLLIVHDAWQDGQPSAPGRAGVLCASIVLAHATKRFVEDPCRAPGFASTRAYQPFAFAGACIAASLGAAFAVHAFGVEPDDAMALHAGELVGARALDDPDYDFARESTDGVAPRPARALKDLAPAYRERCLQDVKGERVKTCVYGSEQAKLHIAVIGDSHAVQWFPAFQELVARRPKLRVTGIGKSGCAFSLDPVFYIPLGRPYHECLTWSRNVVKWLAVQRPDLVIASQSPRHKMTSNVEQDDSALVARGLARAWRGVSASGLRMMAIVQTPWWPLRPAECVSTSKDWQRECVVARSRVFGRDPVTLAAEATRTPLLDMNDAFCPGKRCFPIIGGVLVYRDKHHITATYARTLAKRLEQTLKKHGVRIPR